MHKCILYKKLEGKDKSVQCQACFWYCKINEGGTGICGVRQNNNGDLYLLVYGKAIAANVDNIEKKPLFHFLPGTRIFSIGTVGCNFRCKFCQNWDISQTTALIKKEYEDPDKQNIMLGEVTSEGQDLPPEEIVKYCRENDIPSIAYTYNEPAIFFEYAYDTAKLAHKYGIRNVFVSNGFESKEALEKFHPYLDAINIDLKGFTQEFYTKICGGKLEPVLENIKRVYKMGIWLEVTTLVIPGHNDSDKELTDIAEFIKSVSDEIPWHVTAFYPHYLMRDVPPTTVETLKRAYEIGKKVGLKYVYTGNIPGMEAEKTHCPKCPKCDKELIDRYGLSCDKCDVGEDGKCPSCGQAIPGVWK
jgi:pyruvate formate lyase activating enzyme